MAVLYYQKRSIEPHTVKPIVKSANAKKCMAKYQNQSVCAREYAISSGISTKYPRKYRIVLVATYQNVAQLQ